MALRIDDPEADRLAHALAARTGETVEQSIVTALRERLARETSRAVLRPDPLPDPERAVAEALAIARHVATLPVLDSRDPDDILGYDEHGLPR